MNKVGQILAVTHPTFYSTRSVQWSRGASCAPPFISSEPPLRTEHLPDAPHGPLGNYDPAPDRVGPSQPPLNFVDGNGYIVLRGLVEARDSEVGWDKVMQAWGRGDKKVVAKIFELLVNAARSEDQARDPDLSWQSKSSLGSGAGGPLFKKFHPSLHGRCPSGWEPPPSDAGQCHRGECGEWGPAPPHTDAATQPDISGCHLISFLCL